jgi:hypothetical protein
MVYRFYKKVYIPIRNPQGGGVDISSFSAMKKINQCSVNVKKDTEYEEVD